MTSRVPALIVHGGAGADPGGRDELRRGMRDAVGAGWRALARGGTSLDAVEAAVRALEDHPRFNAGRGSVLTSAGTVETDASIMEGDGLRWPDGSSRMGGIPSSSATAPPSAPARWVCLSAIPPSS
jgi:beta-aspartyl-peptidase (threonine type)